MDSPLARVILAVLGGYLLILISLTVFEWIKEEYPQPSARPLNTERIQHPFYHEQAVNALQRFARLSNRERNGIKKSLESGLISMEQWLTRIGQSDCRIMCIGELHEESTRNFLAEEFFANLSVDVLLLEATPEALRRLTKRMNAGRTYFPLLGADIMNILRTVRAKNPNVQICGIEETDEQQKEENIHSGSRDQSIAHNFWSRYRPGRRHLILFGALHCTNEPNWLFKRLCDQAPLPLKNRMANAQVLEEHQNGPVEAFVFFLDEIGIEKTSFVIPDTHALHACIYAWFPSLNRQALQKYRSLIVFRR
ncbi:hypothetical protein DSCW_30340 [Desulfosarcina widdelii]|uniref:Haem-binding uptake Tiki superfamily ChaN domain-containing protein n=1 Tax=Desulfosarcina widdelii TaxID=947919 RepID=A0A5K7ZHR0_9BACT|nr:hypothetical protein [Desulfosarcina widdelii]BBO75617.1 hypothetical protein DSCW_30340 [Desulfosarcina widdelii]